MLYIVPTPIGNKGDMTPRAVDVLREADLILAEDTRTSGHLLKHFEIQTHMQSFHAHNEHKVLERYISLIHQGHTLALISDAGTPGISDPGYLLVNACHEHDIPVCCLPGATAFVPAIVASGMPSTRFYFEGFLPHKKGRQTRWKFLATLECTIALYESPYRLIKCLNEIAVFFGEQHEVCVCREISKKFEEIKRGTTQDLIVHFGGDAKVKGEIVVVIAPKDNNTN